MTQNTITPSPELFGALKASMPSAAELSKPKQQQVQAQAAQPAQQTQTYTPSEIGARLRSRNPQAFEGFSDEDIGNRAIQRRPELAAVPKSSTGSAAPVQSAQKNIFQEIAQPITDTLATGFRTAQGLTGLVKAGGQALFGDSEGAKRTILESGADVEKPVNIPFLGQGNVRKIGTVKERGTIAPSSETLKTVGTGLELGSFAAPMSPIKGMSLPAKLAVRGAEGIIAGAAGETGRAMQETSDAKEIARRGLAGGISGGIAGSVLAGAGSVASKAFEKVSSPALAARAINAIIKPSKRAFEFGRDPGATVARYKIIGSTMDELTDNIAKAKNTVGQQISDTLSSYVGPMRIDARQSIRSLDEAMQNAANTGDSVVFSRLKELRDRIYNTYEVVEGEMKQSARRKVQGLTPQEAVDLKRLVGDMVKWTEQKTDDDVVNKALYKVYRGIRDQVENIVPSIKKLNDDYGNLLTAEQAARDRSAILQRQNLIGLDTAVKGIGTGTAVALLTGGMSLPAAAAALGAAGLNKALKDPNVVTRLSAMMQSMSRIEKRKLFKDIPWLRNVLIKVIDRSLLHGDKQTPR